MSAFISSIGMPEIIAGLMLLFLNVYCLLGGADFGGGVWDLLASGPRREEQRTLIADSIGPIWEANHVWLIAVVVMLFSGFPSAFATLSVVLHIPLTIMLVGIVMRGSAFMFRSYGSRSIHERHRWGIAFASASVLTPILLGVIVGAISTGAVARVSAEPSGISFADAYVRPWAAPFPLAVGGFALSMFAYLAAVYATVAATNNALREDFRARALGTAGAMFVLAALCLVLARTSAPRVAAVVAGSPWSIVLHLCTATAAVTAIVTLWRREYRVARVAAGAQVTFILWGWALSEYPYLIPDTLTIRAAVAPKITLELMLIGLAFGGAILLPSLRYMMKIFATRESNG